MFKPMGDFSNYSAKYALRCNEDRKMFFFIFGLHSKTDQSAFLSIASRIGVPLLKNVWHLMLGVRFLPNTWLSATWVPEQVVLIHPHYLA